MGWVMQDPRCPNLAKTVAELAGVPPTTPGTTFQENCASGGAAIHSLAGASCSARSRSASPAASSR